MAVSKIVGRSTGTEDFGDGYRIGEIAGSIGWTWRTCPANSSSGSGFRDSRNSGFRARLFAGVAVQTVSFVYVGGQQAVYRNVAEIRFNRQINEDQMDDLPVLAEDALKSLAALESL